MDSASLMMIASAAGAAAGFINIMAGGGSVLTLGVLMAMEMDASMANGTNRIGLIAGSLAGALAYRHEKFGNILESFRWSLWAIPGATLGACIAVRIENRLFEHLLVVVMVFVIVTLFIPPAGGGGKGKTSVLKKRMAGPALFLAGLYGGFIQAGVGFLIMAAFRHLAGMDLIKTNMHKNLLVLFYTVPILLIFGMTRNIHWTLAIVMALGNALGAWASVKISIRKGEKAIRIVLCVAILLMAVKFITTP